VLVWPCAEKCHGACLGDRDGNRINHHQPNCQGQTARLFEPQGSVDTGPAPHPELRVDYQGPRAAGYLAIGFFAKDQISSPSSASPIRSTGPSGWIVETACL